MNYKLTIFLIAIIMPIFAKSAVYLFMQNDLYSHNVESALNKLKIPFEKINSLENIDQKKLYIIDNITSIDRKELPRYYIVYQTEDLKDVTASANLVNRLSNAVAVWDVSWVNINTYKQQVAHYYYFPLNYEFSDPVILPCLLPSDSLKTYKEILIYSNKFNGDISSHLPILFVHGLLQKPKTIMELGVRTGQSSTSFSGVAEYFDAQLIGIDIACGSAETYDKFKKINAKFICMDDTRIASLFHTNNNYHGEKIDIIFIDTSHLYEHTLQEITLYMPLLNDSGMFIFHDSNITPLKNNTVYTRINNTTGYALDQTRGVTKAIKEYFSIDFDEYSYYKSTFSSLGFLWNITHYPFCNGLTVIQKLTKHDA